MLDEYIEKIRNTESVEAYEKAVSDLTDYLYKHGKVNESAELTEVALLKKNRFSKREMKAELLEKKAAVIKYCSMLTNELQRGNRDTILSILRQFPLFCKNLYKSDIHEKCSPGIKEHLYGFCIENEYDLQKLMLAVLSSVFSDARSESVQDTGHHSVRKDIVIDSESAAIELKCTRSSMTERQLSEEIAADMIHYETRNLYFYIYDKAGIIRNAVSFRKTYEERYVEGKNVHVLIYSHGDL